MLRIKARVVPDERSQRRRADGSSPDCAGAPARTSILRRWMLSTVMSPPIARASCRLMESPSPVPSAGRVRDLSPCTNGSKIESSNGARIPRPVSFTSIRKVRPSTAQRTSIHPRSVNFTALESRFSMICSTLSRSTATGHRGAARIETIRKTLLGKSRRDEALQGREKLIDDHVLIVVLDFAGLEPGEVQHVFDQAMQRFLTPLNASQIFALCFRERPANAEFEKFDIAHDRVQRGSKLVAHRREELALRGIRFFGGRRAWSASRCAVSACCRASSVSANDTTSSLFVCSTSS